MPVGCEASARVAAECGAKLQADLVSLFSWVRGNAGDAASTSSSAVGGLDILDLPGTQAKLNEVSSEVGNLTAGFTSFLPANASFCTAECHTFFETFNCTGPESTSVDSIRCRGRDTLGTGWP